MHTLNWHVGDAFTGSLVSCYAKQSNSKEKIFYYVLYVTGKMRYCTCTSHYYMCKKLRLTIDNEVSVDIVCGHTVTGRTHVRPIVAEHDIGDDQSIGIDRDVPITRIC